jgi:hypothetical protein
MIRVPNFCARLLATSVLALASAAQAQPRPEYTWGFEDGTLSGWTAAGDAFANQPTFGNNVVIRRPGESPGQDGDWWLGTYENHPSNAVPPGPVQGDGPQGTLVSPPFTIDGNAVSFLIGGGSDINAEYVSLLIKSRPGLPPPPRPDLAFPLPDGSYQVTLKATGRNDEHMMRTIWDVSQFRGETARFLIVDKASGPWGHINADSFHLSWWAPWSGRVPGGTRTIMPKVPVLGPGPVIVPQGNPAGGAVMARPPVGATTVQAPQVPTVATPLGGGVPAGRTRGHFQLVALQFVARHQTRDDALEMDGPGDEIMVRSDTLTFAPDGHFVTSDRRMSGVFGAPDKWDFVAGSAVPGWSAAAQVGGLKTGDVYPMQIRPVRPNGDLPMVLFDGELERGGNDVLIVPSIWEMEDRNTSPAETAWAYALEQAQMAGRSYEHAFNGTVEDRDSPVWPAMIRTGVFDNGNRPIGAAVHPPHFPWGPLPHDAGMSVQAIPLSFDKAMFFADSPATNLAFTTPDMSVNLPVPPGGIVMHFVDPPGNDGDYYLIMQLVLVD